MSSQQQSIRSAYLAPLLHKHKKNEAIIYESLLESYDLAKKQCLPASSSSDEPQDFSAFAETLNNLHQSQIHAYEVTAKTEIQTILDTFVPTIIVKPFDKISQTTEEEYVDSICETFCRKCAGWKIPRTVLEECYLKSLREKARGVFLKEKKKTDASVAVTDMIKIEEEEEQKQQPQDDIEDGEDADDGEDEEEGEEGEEIEDQDTDTEDEEKNEEEEESEDKTAVDVKEPVNSSADPPSQQESTSQKPSGVQTRKRKGGVEVGPKGLGSGRNKQKQQKATSGVTNVSTTGNNNARKVFQGKKAGGRGRGKKGGRGGGRGGRGGKNILM